MAKTSSHCGGVLPLELIIHLSAGAGIVYASKRVWHKQLWKEQLSKMSPS